MRLDGHKQRKKVNHTNQPSWKEKPKPYRQTPPGAARQWVRRIQLSGTHLPIHRDTATQNPPTVTHHPTHLFPPTQDQPPYMFKNNAHSL